MVIMYSFVFDILKDLDKSFKSLFKSGQKVGGGKKVYKGVGVFYFRLERV